MQWIALGSYALQGINAIQGGRAEQAIYNAQARQARTSGRVDALRYEQQGNELLKRSLEAQATARARAAAGGVDPFSGSAAFIQQLSEKEGIEDLKLLQENAELALAGAETQADILTQSGRLARRRGLLGAATAIGQGIYSYGRLSGPTVMEKV